LRQGGASAENALRDLLADVDAGRTALADARTDFSANVSPQLGAVVDGVFGTLDDLSGLLSTLSGPVDALGKSLESVQTALEHSVSALQGTGKLLAGAKEKLDGVVRELQNVQEGQLWQKLSEIMNNDPATAAGFMAEPVQVDTQSLYPIANYGSAMTPFYTVLCLWVGGLVLIAIIKVKVHDEKQYAGLKPWQAYFGRYLLFLCCGVLQALIACLGDLYILRIQCPNPGLFVLAGVVSSVVFTLFIYTLTVSFGDVGKAIAVIFLVVQVAGAGGTFPIEVTPRFFNIVNPLLPFTSAINAMRETIAGLYSVDYWIDLLKVCAYIPVSLLNGLVLRKP
ncbi:MAG: YhgE/Pip family protein, partial [Oscillospiraceae bacterium]